MDQRSARGQATRERIVEIALGLFAKEGYAAVSIESVLQACSISRGALYHHFASKDAIFAAVLEESETRVMHEIQKAAQNATDPLNALRAGCRAWLQLSAGDPMVRRIVLLDAPAVLGWEKWRQVDARYALGLLRQGLGLIAQSGRMPVSLVEIYAHSVLAVLTELALLVARSPDTETMRLSQEAVEQVLSRFAGVEPYAEWAD